MKIMHPTKRRTEHNPLSVDSCREICSMGSFHFILIRERERTDRSCGIFSLVTLNLYREPDRFQTKRLAEAIHARIRISDSTGWINHTAIGILLVDTPRHGGHAFLDGLLSSIQDMSPVIRECHVFTYPPDSGDQNCEKPPYELFPAESASAERGRIDAARFQEADSTEEATESDRAFSELFAIRPSWIRQIAERILAALILAMISPVLLLIALAIKINSPGPSLYRQVRIGHKGQPFQCYKFRTMHLNVEPDLHDNYFNQLIHSDVPMRKLDQTGDPRIFPVGRWLRASSFDELPQLCNILRGEMSLIGPRPPIPVEYGEYLPWQRHRVDVLPGLTGLWQVSGKNKTTFTQMMRFDLRYTRHQSLRMDARIVLRTIPVVVGQFLDEHPVRMRDGLTRIFKSGTGLYAKSGPIQPGAQPAIQPTEQ